jgi:phage major head subunit gpT-like protein
MTNDLTEANLEKAIEEIRKLAEETGVPIALKPTKVFYRPADLVSLGLTHDDVIGMLK